MARFITGAGLDLLELPGGLAPRALRDIEAGQAAGQFSVTDAEVALSAVAGGLIGLLRLHQQHPERVEESSVDELAGLAGAARHRALVMQTPRALPMPRRGLECGCSEPDRLRPLCPPGSW